MSTRQIGHVRGAVRRRRRRRYQPAPVPPNRPLPSRNAGSKPGPGSGCRGCSIHAGPGRAGAGKASAGATGSTTLSRSCCTAAFTGGACAGTSAGGCSGAAPRMSAAQASVPLRTATAGLPRRNSGTITCCMMRSLAAIWAGASIPSPKMISAFRSSMATNTSRPSSRSADPSCQRLKRSVAKRRCGWPFVEGMTTTIRSAPDAARMPAASRSSCATSSAASVSVVSITRARGRGPSVTEPRTGAVRPAATTSGQTIRPAHARRAKGSRRLTT